MVLSLSNFSLLWLTSTERLFSKLPSEKVADSSGLGCDAKDVMPVSGWYTTGALRFTGLRALARGRLLKLVA